MLNLLSVLKFVKTGVANQDPRFEVKDDEHVFDMKTGVEFHMYDDDFKMTYGENIIAKPYSFTKEEQEVIWELKELITDPVKSAMRKEEYPQRIKEEREFISSLFENPQPIQDMTPMAEEDSTEYTG